MSAKSLLLLAVTALPDDRFSDCIVRGDLVLMQCSAEKVNARAEYYQQKTKEQEDAVNHQLMVQVILGCLFQINLAHG